jgi:DNA-binding GntR family transcriptional regulator
MTMFSVTDATPDRHAPEKLHVQISERIRELLATGQWPPGYRLQSEPRLAEDLGVSRGTLRKALTTLVEDQLLVRVQGRGTFVVGDRPGAEHRMLSTLSEDFAAQGIPLRTSVITADISVPPDPVRRALRLPFGTPAYRLVRLRGPGNDDIALLHNYVRLDLVPDILRVNFAERTLFDVLETDYQLEIKSASRTFSAVGADEEIARSLNLKIGSPVQLLQQTTILTDGRPVEYSNVWINSARLRVTTTLSRHPLTEWTSR